MNVQEELEKYLLGTMTKLCANDRVPNDLDIDACRTIDELGLFEIATPFDRVASALGPGTVASARVFEAAPESLRVSVEHRYPLSRWPRFEFVIFESQGGIAWGQTLARRTGMPIPVIEGIEGLARWSHVESEVRVALGEPISHEGWSPWESSIYHLDDTDFALCYVYGLLQSVTLLV